MKLKRRYTHYGASETSFVEREDFVEESDDDSEEEDEEGGDDEPEHFEEGDE